MIRLGGGAGGGGGKQRSGLVIARLLQSVNSMSNFGVIRYMYLYIKYLFIQNMVDINEISTSRRHILYT